MSIQEERAALEQRIGAALDTGDIEGAATAAINGYGPEVLGFLHALCHDEEMLGEAFSQLCEDVWKGIGGFARRSSFRTWLYTLSRRALYRCVRGQQRRRRHQAPMATWMDAQEQLRTATMPFLRTTVKDRVTQLRESLPREDQELLILRVDRGLDWRELAQTMAEDDELGAEQLTREAARLRKRFQLLKDRLREMAEKEGLLN